LILGLAFAGANLAQTTNTDVSNFEVISVDGNTLVVRDQKGTRELTVPSDFRFTVDGKSMSVSDLKAGMKGTATITTTTTVRPVVVTEVREGEVLRASDLSVTVRDTDGNTRRYAQAQLDTKGVKMFKDGQPARLADLKRGDKLTATIITSGPPRVLTEKEVQATLAEPQPEATATKVAAAGTAEPAAPAATPQAASPQPTITPAAPEPAEASGMGTMWYVVIAIVVLLALFLFMRGRKQA
jgi:hypothetical protein